MNATSPNIAHTVAALRETVSGWRAAGETVALVPTMGALHDGHMALVERALANADRTIVSIFVNPTQFSPSEDLDNYPRTEAADLLKLAAVGVDLTFMPSAAEMYVPGATTTVTVGGLSDGLCGATRPHFFGGVATIVTKLLLQCLPDQAIFGEKDYQQLQVIRQMARDLDIPVEIVGAPTVREADGLALSSRNAYLTPAGRQTAPVLHQTLLEMADRLTGHDTTSIGAIMSAGWQALEEAGFQEIEYLALCDASTLAPLSRIDAPARLLVAAWLGETRLIDNILVDALGTARPGAGD